ncbi:MAG: hypothetical protein HXS47_06500 [Theionarchaea archaeon]|nr:hypothetical protein [Theionarchaea archaeon]
MTCKMECTIKGKDSEKTVAQLMEMAKDYGFIFTGDTDEGTFTYEGKVDAEGEYTRSGKTLLITVTKYPFFIPCTMIISELNKMLSDFLSCEKS